ncbi:MAG: proline racemase family protein [Gemmatimonadota bacterium]|nr:proline racemase family protein [Gemmatimonadota bacterium]
MSSRFPPEIRTCEMHTGGEPVRIVTSGYPQIPGATILDKRRYARERLDHLRRFLMHEPRGHNDMYGVIPVEPDDPDADLAVLFCHNEGYSTMCGHATIAMARWAVDSGVVAAREPRATVRIQCPCGLVTAHVQCSEGRAGMVHFESVGAFAPLLDAAVEVDGVGKVEVDIGYGGAFYAFVPAARFGLDVRTSPARALVDAAWAVTCAAKSQLELDHPLHSDLAFLYGTILTDGGAGDDRPSANVCVFADRQVDRSPTGSGVTARMAIQKARGLAGVGDERRFSSVTGSVFTGCIVEETMVGEHEAVTVLVGGEAHYTGEACFRGEEGDPLRGGFTVR